MPDASADANAPQDESAVSNRPVRNRWQIGLQTLCLLVVAVGVWTNFAVNRSRNAELEARIAVMRPLARELTIEDPGKIAIIKLDELWMGDNQWDLYLPEGRYRLCMATHDIKQSGLAPVVKSARIGPGRHHIELAQQEIKAGWQVVARWDGVGEISTDELKAWDTGSSSTSEGGYTTSTQLPADQLVTLLRLQFIVQGTRTTTSSASADGILLWIERAE